MIITPENGEGNYRVEYFESRNFMPLNNSDGITPEARGSLQIDGNTATIDLIYKTDTCFGDSIGTGTRIADGVLDLKMDITDCIRDEAEPAPWKLVKTEEL